VEVAAVADPVAEGAAAALKRTGAKRAYSDYREMLRVEKPDLVSIGPRWLDQRIEMVEAATGARAHIFMEKPFARDPVQADRLVAAVQRAGVKLQLAHVMRASGWVQAVGRMVREGGIGTLFELRGRGKEDRRAGGEDLIVLGSHILDLFRLFAGDPRWCMAHVTQNGSELKRDDAREPTEPVGLVAGTEVSATFAFDRGVHGYFSSVANPDRGASRYGIFLYGSRGVIFMPNEIYPAGQPFILRNPSWMPDKSNSWEPVRMPQAPPPPSPISQQHLVNTLMVRDLLDSIEQNRKPLCSEVDGRWTVEMVAAVYRSQLTGARVTFPLADRNHPLGGS
jgi:predicted dehydrogenase